MFLFSSGYWTPPADLNLGGIYLPSWLIIGFAGFLMALLLAWILEKSGATRHVWNLPLFFIAMVVTFTCLLSLLLFR